MIAILLNCVTLGMYQPCSDEVCTTPRCKALQVFDDMIFAFFAIEMIIKMTAMGISGSKTAYLSDTWNRLDCFIVLAGYVHLVHFVTLIVLKIIFKKIWFHRIKIDLRTYYYRKELIISYFNLFKWILNVDQNHEKLTILKRLS